MIKKIIAALFLQFIFHSCLAQDEPKRLIMTKNGDYLSTASISLDNANILDTTILLATYTFRWHKSPFMAIDWKEEKSILQIGNKYTKFIPYALYDADKVYTANPSLPFPMPVSYPKLWTVYYHIKNQELISEHRVPFEDESLIEYPETGLDVEWSLTGETQTILGYTSNNAVGVHRGVEWSVWFTTEIPARLYLWTLGGLPGLILKAESEKYYFECESVKETNELILRPSCKYQTMTREQWRKFEKRYHDTPYQVFNDNDGTWFYHGNVRLTQNNWTIFYEPIEVE